ncbi:unnamed protein product [Effrenium voratum]|nr:unnamed protein product [Effrenium voratum]
MVILPDVTYGAATSVPLRAHCTKDSLRIDMEIKFPKKEKKARSKAEMRRPQRVGSMLSSVFTEQKYPEPVYFQSVDCVGIPNFLSEKECRKIIDFAEAQGFKLQNRHRVLNMMWADLIDPFLSEALWERAAKRDGLGDCESVKIGSRPPWSCPSWDFWLLGNKSSDSGVTELVGVGLLWFSGSWVLLQKGAAFGALFAHQVAGSPKWRPLALKYPVLVLLHCLVVDLSAWLQRRLARKWRQNITRKLHRMYFEKQNFYRLQAEPREAVILDADVRICRDVHEMAHATAEVAVAVMEALMKTLVFGASTLFQRNGAVRLWGLCPPAVFLVAVKVVLGTHPSDGKTVQTSLQHFEGRLKQHFLRLQTRARSILMIQGEPFELDLLQKALRDMATMARKLYDVMFGLEMTEWMILHTTQAASLLELAAFTSAALLGMRSISEPAGPQEARVLGQQLRRVQDFFSVCSGWSAFLSSRTLLMASAAATGRVKQLYVRLECLDTPSAKARPRRKSKDPAPELYVEGETLTFRSVTLHTPAKQALLRDLTFSVEKGPLLVCGHALSGKSVLAKALFGLWPLVGQITRPGASHTAEGIPLPEDILYMPERPLLGLVASLSDEVTFPRVCGLSWFLRNLAVDGQVPCGLNDVIRIQKFGPGGLFGRHTDQPVQRADGRVSKYSIRIFLNSMAGKEFEARPPQLATRNSQCVERVTDLIMFWNEGLRSRAEVFALCCRGVTERQNLEDHFEALMSSSEGSVLPQLALTLLGDFREMPSLAVRVLSARLAGVVSASELFLFDRMLQVTFIAVQQLVKCAEKAARLDAQRPAGNHKIGTPADCRNPGLLGLRCLELVVAVEATSKRSTSMSPQTTEEAPAAGDSLHFSEKELVTEDGVVLARRLQFEMVASEPLLICGPSGFAKPLLSRLLLGEALDRAKGIIARPPRQTMLLCAQEPYVPGYCRLLALLACPLLLRLPSHPPFTVHVAALPESVTEPLLRQHFAALNAASCQVVVERGCRKGLVYFSTFEEIIKAVARPQDRVIGDTELQCEIAAPGAASPAGEALPRLVRMRKCLRAVDLDHVLTREQDGWFARRSWPELLTREEQQRLCLARVLYHQPTFCILEEATCTLAPQQEARIMELLLAWHVTPLALSSAPEVHPSIQA